MTLERIADAIRRRLLSGEAYARRLGVTIGADCRILTYAFGSEPFLISIGDHVTISSGVTFINHDGSAWLARDRRGRRYAYRRIVIGDWVFVGASAIILPGVEIGNRVVVGAGSVVTRSIPSDSVVAGNPARFIGSYEELEARWLEMPSAVELDPATSYRDRVAAALDPLMQPKLKTAASGATAT